MFMAKLQVLLSARSAVYLLCVCHDSELRSTRFSKALTLVWKHVNRHSKFGTWSTSYDIYTFMLFHTISFEFGNLHRVSPQEIELKQLLTSFKGVDAMYRCLALGLYDVLTAQSGALTSPYQCTPYWSCVSTARGHVFPISVR